MTVKMQHAEQKAEEVAIWLLAGIFIALAVGLLSLPAILLGGSLLGIAISCGLVALIVLYGAYPGPTIIGVGVVLFVLPTWAVIGYLLFYGISAVL